MDISERMKRAENAYMNVKETIRSKQDEINKLNEELLRLQGEYRILKEFYDEYYDTEEN